MDAISQFIEAMCQRGLIPPHHPIADGKIHRCGVGGKGGKGDGAYLLHLDGIPAGGFQNHKDGLGWQGWRADIGRPLTREETLQHKAKVEAMRRERERDEARRHAEGKAEARRLLAAGKPSAGNHPYEIRKRIGAQAGVMVGEWLQRGKKNCLLIPLYEGYGAQAELWNVQAIFPEKDARMGRDKDLLFGARKAGLHFVIGEITEGVTVYVVEGYATGVSVHEAMNSPVVVAIDAGNLLKIVLPPIPLARSVVVCADNDESGTGLKYAQEAARRWANEGRKVQLIMPPVVGQDFNDFLSKEYAA